MQKTVFFFSKKGIAQAIFQISAPDASAMLNKDLEVRAQGTQLRSSRDLYAKNTKYHDGV